jgi:dUTP pyrophosphatase
MKIKIKKLNENATIPTRAKESDAGYDLYASTACVIDPMSRVVVSTSIALEIPPGYYGRIAPRSGLSIKGIDVLGGVVDSGYRSEIGVILINLNLNDPVSKNSKSFNERTLMFGSRNRFFVEKGDRIAQIIIEKCHDVEFEDADFLTASERGDGGYGSSGV